MAQQIVKNILKVNSIIFVVCEIDSIIIFLRKVMALS